MAATCPNCKGGLDTAHDCLTREKPVLERAELEISFDGQTAVFVPKPRLQRAQSALVVLKRSVERATETARFWQELCSRAWARGDEHERLLHDSGLVAVAAEEIEPIMIEGEGAMCSGERCVAFHAGRCEMSGKDLYTGDGIAICEVAS